MRLTADAGEKEKLAGIRKTRVLASGILAGLVLVFLASLATPNPSTTILLLRAMAEAGMIGGLADWFAVEALFRRPLRLPIPHTALLPSNQKRAARAVGTFFQRNFLDAEQIRARVLRLRPSRRAIEWLGQSGNAHVVARLLVHALKIVVRDVEGVKLGHGLRRVIRDALTQTISEDKVAPGISALLRDALQGDVTDRLLGLVRAAIVDNRQKATALVRDQSRWWIANRVDKEVAGLLVKGVISVIDELGTRDSPLRTDFDTALARIVRDLEKDGTIAALVRRGKENAVSSNTVDGIIDTFGSSTIEHLLSQLEHDPDAVVAALVSPLRGLVVRIAHRDGAAEEMDVAISDIVAHLIAQLGPQIATYVSETIADWDPDELVRVFELEVGRDLQFIRINGAVLGALLGGIIFSFDLLLGEFVSAYLD